MIYIDSISSDPCFNQALEEFVFENFTSDIILIWRNKPAVVCGKFQNLLAEVNVKAAEDQGVSLVRRISGGGTVYHDLGNINYSIIKNTESSTTVNYDDFLVPVIKVLSNLGVNANIIAGNGIGIGDKKISGSAQRIVKGRVLHHGTLLFDADLKKLKSLANGHREFFTSSGTASVPWPVTNIKDYITDIVSPSDFEKLLTEEFKKEFPGEVISLSEVEISAIHNLSETKYKSWDWTFGTGPKVRFQRDIKSGDGIFNISYDVIKGIIKNVKTVPENKALNEVLDGRALILNEIREALEKSGFSDLTEYII